MCLILVAWRVYPEAPLVVAANRDEWRSRPALPLQRWERGLEGPQIPPPQRSVSEAPGRGPSRGRRPGASRDQQAEEVAIVGDLGRAWTGGQITPDGLVCGRDATAGGTWLAVRPDGAFAAVTNWREPGARAGGRSRGELPVAVLRAPSVAEGVADAVARGAEYGGFHVIGADSGGLWTGSNREPGVLALPPGVYAVSNGPRGAAWPKMVRGRAGLEAHGPDVEGLLRLLADREAPPDEALPDTGVGLELERALGPVFIDLPAYGTRVSTVVVAREAAVRVVEQTHDEGGGRRELAW